MTSSDGGEGGGEEAAPLTVEGIRNLIAEATQDLRRTAELERTKLEKKLAESEAVIAEQARRLAAVKEEKGKAAAVEKAYCAYGTDGEGKGNPWPRRSLNDPKLLEPHLYDTGDHPTNKLLVGRHRGSKHEWVTLGCQGSYLHDFNVSFRPLLKLLTREDPADSPVQVEDNKLWAAELGNTLEAALDLGASRFKLLTEYVQPNVDLARIEELERRLFTREGVEAPASSVDEWNSEFDKRVQIAYDKKLANKSAETRFSRLGAEREKTPFKPGARTEGDARPRPRGDKK